MATKNAFILHQDNAPACTAFFNQDYTWFSPWWPPDLAPCDFCLFLNVKSVLPKTYYKSVDSVKKKTANKYVKATDRNWFVHFFLTSEKLD